MSLMKSNEHNTFLKPNTNSVPQDETMNLPTKPLPPPWSTSEQDFHNFGSSPTSSLNPAGSNFCSLSWLAQQTWSKLPQNDSLHDHRKLNNYPMAAGVGQGALLAYAHKIHRTFGENNMNSMKTFNKGFPPMSKAAENSRKNEKTSSIPKTNREGPITRSAARESMRRSILGRDFNNLQDSPSITKKKRSRVVAGNGGGAQNVTSTENCNVVHKNKNIASDHLEANPTEPNENLGTGLNATDTNPQLQKQEDDKTKYERKRLANREACKRFRIKKLKQCEELSRSLEYLEVRNAVFRIKLRDLSKDCEELTNENNALMEELVEKYGQETVTNYLNAKPT